MLIAKLGRGKEKKLLNKYPWIFEDEVISIEGDPQPGAQVNVFSSDYVFIGRGLFNPFSNRRIMFMTTTDRELDREFFMNRLKRALTWRERFYEEPYYRLVHGEADGLPGLIVDRYGDVLVVQFRNYVMEQLKPLLVELLTELISPRAVYERGDFETGVNEPIKKNVGLIYGTLESSVMEVHENGIRYIVDIARSQKTGFFFDQKDNRAFARNSVKKFGLRKGLDVFSFTGGFGLNMALAGASSVCIDKSQEDLDLAKENARLNGIQDRMKFLCADAFDYLDSLERKDQFDIVVLDPPSLVKHKKEVSNGITLFKRLVSGGISTIKDNGVLGVCSCAYNIGISQLIEAMRKATEINRAGYKYLDLIMQSKDHPWEIQIPESLYLKCLWTVIEKE